MESEFPSSSKSESLPGEGLHEAARKNHAVALRALVDAGADVNCQDGEGWTALKVAALVDGASSIRLLAERGGNVDMADRRGRTPLLEAAWHHNAAAVRALLDAGASPDLEDPQWGPAIADTDCCDCVQLLVEAGARIDVIRRRYLSAPHLLEMAAQKGHLDLMRQLVGKGATLSACSLAWSARRGDGVALLWQISQGADVQEGDSLGETPLMGAAEQRSTAGCSGLATCLLLLQHGADPARLNCVGHAAAHKAVMADDPDCLKGLLKFPLPPEAQPLLHLAASLNRVNCLNILLRVRLDSLNVRWHGGTPLMAAAAAGALEAVEVLVDAGAKLEARDLEGTTALFHGVFYARTEVLKFLVKAGARLNASDHQGRTPLMRAAEGIHSGAMVPLLLTLGADPLCKDQQGGDAALYACLNAKTDGKALHQILEVAGGQQRARQLQLPLAQAAMTGRVWPELTRSRARVLEVLLQWGADPLEPHLVGYVQASEDRRLKQLLRKRGVDVSKIPVEIKPNWDWDH